MLNNIFGLIFAFDFSSEQKIDAVRHEVIVKKVKI